MVFKGGFRRLTGFNDRFGSLLSGEHRGIISISGGFRKNSEGRTQLTQSHI